jgi:hypothetical protein
MARRGKVVRKEKPKRERWVVVNALGALKYPAKLGEDVVGFEREQAERLARPAHETHSWIAVPVGYWRGEHEYADGKPEGVE